MTPQRMFDIRERLCWPRAEVARLLGCSIGLVRRWETGIVPIPPSIGEWMRHVGRWGKSLPQPPTSWRTRSARDDDETVVRTYPVRHAAITLTTPQEHDMGTDQQDRPGFIEEAVDRQIGRLSNEILDREQDGALLEAIDNLRKEMHWRISELQARLDAFDKHTHENTRVMLEIARDMRNAPWVVQTPDELSF